MHFVYMLRCADGTIYTGYARDPERRAQVHNSGRGARYTSGRRPVCLIYVERCRSVGAALRREHQMKSWSRSKKEALIARKEALIARGALRPSGRAASSRAARR